MFLIFTPYTYLFFSIYCLFLFALTSVSNFYGYWFIIELITLLLIGLSYTVFTNSVSQLMVYFLIQSVSSFIILVSYLLNLDVVLTVSFLLNLGIFPFLTWYLNSLSRFPNFVFWLTGTLHNLPPLFILIQFTLLYSVSLFWLSILLNTLVAGFLMVSTFDFRVLLVASSIGNNSWFILSQQVSLPVFLSFMFIYSLFLGLLLTSLNQFSNFSSLSSNTSSYFRLWFYILSISGLPPFPIFFLKMSVILSLFSLGLLNYFMLLFLFMNVFIVAGYISYMINTLVYRYSSPYLA